MAVTPIPVTIAPFQGSEASDPTRAFGSILNVIGAAPSTVGVGTAAALNMSFVNDGYTVLFVTTVATVPQLTITAVSDNAGRSVNIGPTILVANQTRAFGPFRPVWWNYGGTINITFSAAPTNIVVAAVSFVF